MAGVQGDIEHPLQAVDVGFEKRCRVTQVEAGIHHAVIDDIAVGHDSFYGAQRREAEEERPAKLGKKEQAAAEAETAGQGTGWGDDLIPHGKH